MEGFRSNAALLWTSREDCRRTRLPIPATAAAVFAARILLLKSCDKNTQPADSEDQKLAAFFKVVRGLHRWLGVGLALLLIVISLSGVGLIWQTPINRILYPEGVMAFDGAPDSAARVAMAAEQALGMENVERVMFGDRDFGVSEVVLVDGRTAFIAADGQLVKVWAPNGRWDDWLVDLHHRLLAGTTGLYVVGFGGIAALITILAGCIAFWPTRASWRKGVLPRSTNPQTLRRSHRNVGVWASLPLAVLILTGIALTFPQTANRAIAWTYEKDPYYGEDFGEGVDMLEGRDQAAWHNAFRRAVDVFPGAVITGAIWPTDQSEIVIELRNPGDWIDSGTGEVQITAIDGYMDLRIDGRRLPAGERIWNSAAPLHTGAIRGSAYKILETIFGLCLIYLAVIGLISFFRTGIRGR